MKQILYTAAVAAASLMASAGTASADKVKTQDPCLVCARLDSTTGQKTFTAQKIGFTAGQAGTAIVRFDGYFSCSNNASAVANVFLRTQIVDDDVEPDGAGPSGINVNLSVIASDGNTRALAFNLAASRVFAMKARQARTFRLQVGGSVPPDASCAVRHGAFTVEFVDSD